VKAIRLFARGNADGSREFSSVTLRAKSAGSETFDICIGTFKPTHPYTLLDADTFAILDLDIDPVVATAFRAEFKQLGAVGPRVLELDAFVTQPQATPAIVVNPQSQTVVKKNDATFQVVARGGKLRYQWKFNGQNIRGANSDTLLIDTAKHPDRGTYSVVVSNDLGSVESAPAVLSVVNNNSTVVNTSKRK
jgi:hypothetical protein